MGNDNFIFSIIIAIYNTEKYLDEAIESIINQSFDFNKVQLILVDDGSTDQSKQICKKYENKYPKNVIYVYQENSGQSSARNNGLEFAKGKYVNFLDSDDKLEINALEEVYGFFDRYGDEIDVIVIPRHYFGAVNGPMNFGNKFDENRIVDINKEFDFPQVSISAAFTRLNALPENFNTELIISEDSLLINKTILNKAKFGVVGSTKYLYRKRLEENSTIDTKKTNKKYYIPRMNHYFKELINYSIQKYGYVLKYIQSVMMYDFQWLFLEDTAQDVLNDDELNEFNECIREVLQVIDDDIILSQRFLNRFYEYHILSLKHINPNFKTILSDDDGILEYNNKLFDKFTKHNIIITKLSKKFNLVRIEGFFESCLNDFSVVASQDDESLLIQRVYGDEDYAMGNKVSRRFYFQIISELKKGSNTFSLNVSINDKVYPIDIYSKLADINYNKNNLIIEFDGDYSDVDFILNNYRAHETELDYARFRIEELQKEIEGFSEIINEKDKEKHELINNLKYYKDKYVALTSIQK